ncbi:unnamed protein product [Coregonus sp. 'balchen']
MHVEM